MQGWSPREHPYGLAQALRPQHCRPRLPHLHLLHWLLRFPEHQARRDRLPLRRKPHEEGPASMGLLLVSY